MIPEQFLKLVVDPDRLAVAGLVAAAARTVAELAEATGQRERAVVATLAPLLAGGIVVRESQRYALVRESLVALAKGLPQPSPPDPRVLADMTTDEQAVLGRLHRGGRLTEIPTQRAKRLVVLERLALEFEPGTRYPEAEVNALLGACHDDRAAPAPLPRRRGPPRPVRRRVLARRRAGDLGSRR